MSTPPLHRWSHGLHRLGLALLGGWLGWHPLIEGDTFWHLTLGRAVLRHASRVVPEPSALPAWSDPCVVPEWLWDVFTYAVYQVGGLRCVSLLSAVFGAIIGYCVARFLEALNERRLGGLHAALGVLTMCVIADQLNVRPNLAFLALLPTFGALAFRYRAAATPARLGVALLAVALGWAQVHASFVLAPAIFLTVVVPARVAREGPGRRALLRLDGAVLLGLLLCTLSCAHGTDVVELVLQHSGGDATRHVADMQRYDWAMLAPLAWPQGAVLCLFIVTGSVTPLVTGRCAASAVGLALLGATMTFTANRFAVAWAILLLPWAIAGANTLLELHEQRASSARIVHVSYASLALLILAWAQHHIAGQFGPLFHTGLPAGSFPESSARYLRRMPRGTQVFTEYATGGPLGFWLDGHARTFVDGRTPLVFDATDWAVARDMLASPAAFAQGVQRYQLTAAVIDRNSSNCEQVAAHWRPVLIEARYTLFVADSPTAAFSGLNACGRFFMNEHACDDGGAAVSAAIERLARLDTTPFNGFLRAAAALQCQRGSAAQALASLPAPQDARAYLPAYRWYLAQALLRLQRSRDAIAVLDAALADDDPLPLRVLLDASAESISIPQARRLLERGIEQMDDNAPAALRARLALICAAQHDAECARFQGLRAALRGAPEAWVAVQWAAQHHASPRVRRDLQAWLLTNPNRERN